MPNQQKIPTARKRSFRNAVNKYVVQLYIWRPTSILTIVEQGILPDLGHAALEVVGTEEPLCYVSFWPEMDSPVGQMTNLLKPRLDRNPISYAQECDPTDGYMQRPADFVESVVGLNEEKIIRGWQRLQNVKYDFLHWNCSNVVKFLTIRGMSREDQERLREYVGCSDRNLEDVNEEATDFTDTNESLEVLTERLRRLALTDFIRCIPEDLLELVQALRASREAIPAPHSHH